MANKEKRLKEKRRKEQKEKRTKEKKKKEKKNLKKGKRKKFCTLPACAESRTRLFDALPSLHRSAKGSRCRSCSTAVNCFIAIVTQPSQTSHEPLRISGKLISLATVRRTSPGPGALPTLGASSFRLLSFFGTKTDCVINLSDY